MADAVEEIKAKLDIVNTVSQYVQLKKAGVNYKACCPFHSEKTPSFVVSPEKQIFHCFGCHKGGDIFTFVEEVESVEFTEALQILADKAGIKLEKLSKYEKKGDKSEKDEYYKAHDLACEKYEEQLHKTKDGKKVLEYLYKRGLKDETIKEFRIGFAPDDYNFLHDYLIKKGISKNVLLKSGLCSAKNIASDNIYDKFRGRLMFPIFNYVGRVCGFGGRALSNEQSPKYLNSPENIIYNKSKVLYGLYHAKDAIKKESQVVLVEGYFDVVLPHQEGVENVVAVSGTALTEYQVGIIKRLTTNIVTCFDLDKAGFEATKRSYSIIQNAELVMKTVGGFAGKDPADLVKDKGGDEFKKYISGAKDFFSFYMKKLTTENDILTLDGRRSVLKEVLPIYKTMNSGVKDLYVRELSSLLNIKEQYLYDEIDSFSLPGSHPARQTMADGALSSGSAFDLKETIISIVLINFELFEVLKKAVDDLDFSDEEKVIYKGLQDQYNSMRTKSGGWNLEKGFPPELKGKLDVLLLYAEERYSSFSGEALTIELGKLVDKVKKMKHQYQLRELVKALSEAEDKGDTKKVNELLVQQQELLQKKE